VCMCVCVCVSIYIHQILSSQLAWEKQWKTHRRLIEGEGSVRLTSSLRKLVLQIKNIFISIKSNWSELVSTRRSNVLILPLQLEFPVQTQIEENAAKVGNGATTFCQLVTPPNTQIQSYRNSINKLWCKYTHFCTVGRFRAIGNVVHNNETA